MEKVWFLRCGRPLAWQCAVLSGICVEEILAHRGRWGFGAGIAGVVAQASLGLGQQERRRWKWMIFRQRRTELRANLALGGFVLRWSGAPTRKSICTISIGERRSVWVASMPCYRMTTGAWSWNIFGQYLAVTWRSPANHFAHWWRPTYRDVWFANLAEHHAVNHSMREFAVVKFWPTLLVPNVLAGLVHRKLKVSGTRSRDGFQKLPSPPTLNNRDTLRLHISYMIGADFDPWVEFGKVCRAKRGTHLFSRWASRTNMFWESCSDMPV